MQKTVGFWLQIFKLTTKTIGVLAKALHNPVTLSILKIFVERNRFQQLKQCDEIGKITNFETMKSKYKKLTTVWMF